MFARKYPCARFLEAGAAPRGSSKAVLESLEKGSPRFLAAQIYDYTDISENQRSDAERRFKCFAEQMRYRKPDIEQDPMGQGFEAESSDLVIACHVLHNASDIQKSIQKLRQLLRPGARLLVVEDTLPPLHESLAPGLLPRRWSSQDEQKWSLVLNS